MSLARDATSSGDPVLAENYLQHAEHYNRIIMAFRDQQVGQGGGEGMNGGMPRNRPFMANDMEGEDYGDDEGDDGDMQPQHQPQPQTRHSDHQPRPEGQRFEGQRGGHDQNRFRDRHDHRNRNHERGERHDRGEQHGGQPMRQRGEGVEASGQQPSPEGQFQRRDRFPQQQHEQPEFLRRPVRRPRREGNGSPGEVNGNSAGDDTDRD
jgi:hypothetical protein